MMTTNETKSRSWWDVIKSCSGTELDRLNQRRMLIWTIAWALSYVAASRMLKSDPELAGPMIGFLVAAPNLIAVGVVFAYLRFLRMADELLRKIQLEGLALGFAVGLMFITGYQLVEAAGASELESDHIILVMVFSWMAGQLLGTWRYR